MSAEQQMQMVIRGIRRSHEWTPLPTEKEMYRQAEKEGIAVSRHTFLRSRIKGR